jgi:CubicO group peptidase (beta-lactamase class C family)
MAIVAFGMVRMMPVSVWFLHSIGETAMRFERTTALAAALVLALGAGLANGAAAQAIPQPEPVRPYVAPALEGFDAYVENVRSTFDVPGIAVAVIMDGQVVLERGYGLRDIDAGAPVDARTLF